MSYDEEEEDAFIWNWKQNIDQYKLKIKSVIVSWCRRPPKDSRRVALVEVTYEKNEKHIFSNCGYSDIVNERRTWESDEKVMWWERRLW